MKVTSGYVRAGIIFRVAIHSMGDFVITFTGGF